MIFFEGIDETRGMSFLYRMMELVRGHEEKINFARMMYLLSRLEPTEEGTKKEKIQTVVSENVQVDSVGSGLQTIENSN
ncbi:hypothetical protein M5E86_18200 [Blautia wexlerae]|nr:hypothetical protein M5E86_18200 [Blautia wexlerae]